MEIILKSNIKEFVKYLDNVEKKQVPFATSLALNATAIEAQKAVVDAIPDIFNNRKKWWLKQQPTGVKVQFTTKGSKSKGIASNMKSRVYTDAPFAPRQEKGEIKKARGKNLAIPKKENVLDKFEKAGSAKLLMNDTKQYFKTDKAIFRRLKNNKLKYMYALSPTAKVKPRFNFEKIVTKVIKRRFEKIFKEKLAYALSTAKPPSPK